MSCIIRNKNNILRSVEVELELEGAATELTSAGEVEVTAVEGVAASSAAPPRLGVKGVLPVVILFPHF